MFHEKNIRIQMFKYNPEVQNPPPNLGVKTEISRVWSIPDHQEGIKCKGPRSDD